MTAIVALMLCLTAVSGAFVVLSRDPKRQIFAIAANGVVMSGLFFVLQAPDVALSEIAVGSAVTPLLFLVTLAALRMNALKR